MTNVIDSLAYFYGEPSACAALKVKPEHFFVSEELNFTPSGTGEHFLVRIRKIGENTKYVANELAKACGVKSRDVSWAGLKDRHAITEQWFSVHLPGKPDPDLTAFVAEHEGIDAILATTRHQQKMRPGDLIANQFELILSNIQGEQAQIDERLEQIKTQGVPNYFGSQRFGNEGNNLVAAREWGQNKFQVKDKSKRSFYLSAARSHLFNLVLSERIKQHLLTPLLGDLLINDAGLLEQVNSIEQAQSLLTANWQISGPLTGDNALPTQADALNFEQNIIDVEPHLLALIRANRMRHERRALMLHPQNLTWEWMDNSLKVAFSLPAGAFATAVMREVIKEETNAHIDQ